MWVAGAGPVTVVVSGDLVVAGGIDLPYQGSLRWPLTWLVSVNQALRGSVVHPGQPVAGHLGGAPLPSIGSSAISWPTF